MAVEIDSIQTSKSIGWTDARLTRLAAGSIQTPKLTIAGGTITTDLPVVNGTVTWNAGGVTFTADKINVTDTASAAGSLLIDRQVGGTSKFKVSKAGLVTVADGATFAGNVGIGTVSPGASLHTVGDGLFYSNTNTVVIVESNGGAASLFLKNTAGTQRIIGGSGGLNNIDFHTNDVFRVRIDENGNVGIGTTSPGHQLHVYGGGNESVLFENFSTNETQLGIKSPSRQFKLAVAGASSTIGLSAGSFAIRDYTAGYNRFVIDTTGNVGIGTASPSANAKLHIDGSNAIIYTEPSADDGQLNGIQLLSSNGTVRAGLTLNSLTGEIRHQAIAGYFHVFYANNVEALRLNSSGNTVIAGSTNLGIKTIATLPSAASSSGERYQLSDSATVAYRIAFSNGSAWYYEGTAAAV